MDLDGPGRDVQVGRKSPYPQEFRKDAVALYRAAGGKRTYAAVAADLGITAESLRTWVRKENESQALPEHREAGGSPAEELARLRAENARLLKAEKEWQLEREILRRAAAYFAREVK
jgi:transposase